MNVEEQLFKISKTVVEQPEPKGLRNLMDSLIKKKNGSSFDFFHAKKLTKEVVKILLQ